MNADPQLFSSPTWTYYFTVAANLMFAGCLYHAIKVGIYEFADRSGESLFARLAGASTQVLFLCFFASMYWLLESAAHSFTPYYVYSPDFPDLVRMGSFAEQAAGAFPGACPEYVRWLGQQSPAFRAIPLSVLLMEASLTYAGMWTALLLGVNYRLVPLWAGLFVVLVDVFLDPVVAGKYDCSGARLAADAPGLGFWHWFVPTGEDAYLGSWFGVPLFNYAAWFFGPTVLISIAMIVQYLRGRVWRRVRSRPVVPVAPEGRQAAVLFLLLLIGACMYLLTFIAPSDVTREIPIWLQWSVMGGAIGLIALLVIAGIPYKTEQAHSMNLTLPPSVFLVFPAVAMLIEGLFLDVAGLIVVGFLCLAAGLFLTLWPYDRLLLGYLQRLIDVDRFIRLAYFGFPSTMVLLGAFSVAIERTDGRLEFSLTNWQIGGLLTTAMAFHIFAYVSNDVIDLPVDKTQGKRQRDPLVRGAISVQAALALSLVTIPLVILVSFLVSAAPMAYAAMIAGFGLMTVYNVWGKRCSFPIATDLAQGLGWGMLVLYGALVVDPTHSSDNWALVWAVFVFGALFIMLVSGISGGLRDYANDVSHDRVTAARLLGARADGEGQVVSSRGIMIYAYALHAAMFLLPAMIALEAVPSWLPLPELELEKEELRYVAIVLGVVFVLSQIVLHRVVRVRESRRDQWVSLWGLVVMQAPLLAFAPFVGNTLHFVMLTCFYAPLMSSKQFVVWLVDKTHPRIAGRVLDPPESTRETF